ncbi:Protein DETOXIFICATION 18 [Labeo rohita]|uniref:Protein DETOXIFICATION 18 n=1 Tax=Labeo rohita TaxID=84645 RepID=A0ABQ8LW80_LABRO|nr:Protein DETOXIFICATION 18 [Labeo rohita]
MKTSGNLTVGHFSSLSLISLLFQCLITLQKHFEDSLYNLSALNEENRAMIALFIKNLPPKGLFYLFIYL